jgi:hypothetical protein
MYAAALLHHSDPWIYLVAREQTAEHFLARNVSYVRHMPFKEDGMTEVIRRTADDGGEGEITRYMLGRFPKKVRLGSIVACGDVLI